MEVRFSVGKVYRGKWQTVEGRKEVRSQKSKFKTISPIRISLLIGIVTGFLVLSVQGKVIYVDAGADLGGDGVSWGTAYKYLQDALYEPPAYGDEIWVAAGRYYPDEDYEGAVTLNDRAESFRIPTGVALYGGFASGGAWEERDPSTYETILSGDLAGNDGEVEDPYDLLSDPDRAENSFHVVIVIDTDPNTILDGFNVTGGNANGLAPDEDGGGIYGYPFGKATITNCTIQGNSAISYHRLCHKRQRGLLRGRVLFLRWSDQQ